jgi:energy-coupling factor transporter ATP-binding protein EcfA2
VIIGANGSGKTTVMEALASLTFEKEGQKEGLAKFPFHRGTSDGTIALYQAKTALPAAAWTQQSHRRLPRERYLFVYGRYRRVFAPDETDSANRRLVDPAALLDELARHCDVRRTVTLNQPDNNLLRDLAGYLIALEFGARGDTRLSRIWKQLDESLPRLDPKLTGIRMEEGIPMVVRGGITLELGELSDGYQALLVVVFDLMLRYGQLFLDLDNPLEGRAVVGIDEVDLHLHPRWQRTVIDQLENLFPNTQFVLTTHSPVVVQGAIDRGRSVVTLREHEGAVTAKGLSRHEMQELRGAEVGSLLFDKHLFGVSSRYSTGYAQTEVGIADLQKRISRGNPTDEEYQELSEKVGEMETLVAREDKRRADGSTVGQMAELRGELVKDLLKELRLARRTGAKAKSIGKAKSTSRRSRRP